MERARGELVRLAGDRAAWSYRPGGEPSVEPTVLAVLGILSAASDPDAAALSGRAAGWLAGLQQANGSLGISAANPEPGWPTAHALLAFQAVDDRKAERKRALDWLLTIKGTSVKGDRSIIAHDASLVGWPWVNGTHSWIEPTVVALFAMAGEGLKLHERFREALRLIRDRALSTGGWNVGQTVVLGNTTRPQPAPTGMSLAALALDKPAKDATLDKEEASRVDKACEYLEKMLPTVRSPQSLGWGLLGLSAWDRRPRDADLWLAQSAEKSQGWSDPAVEWAMLLLAAGSRGLELLNVSPRKTEPAKAGL